MTNWQPIETAPKDGRIVIAWFPKGERTNGVRQLGDDYVESVRWNGDEWSWTQDGDTPLAQPTHWMPLPNPPKEQGTEE